MAGITFSQMLVALKMLTLDGSISSPVKSEFRFPSLGTKLRRGPSTENYKKLLSLNETISTLLLCLQQFLYFDSIQICQDLHSISWVQPAQDKLGVIYLPVLVPLAERQSLVPSRLHSHSILNRMTIAYSLISLTFYISLNKRAELKDEGIPEIVLKSCILLPWPQSLFPLKCF